ncbi:MAG: recombination protein RecR [Anaerolineaceae bacterium]|nr:recombination protein RecR [Anaerolineaceae bacterium]
MAILPESLQNLINSFESLPGIGPKTASRLAFYLLKAPDYLSDNLSMALAALKSETGTCKICCNITMADKDICDICASDDRDDHVLYVVEEPLDVLALERTAGFLGRYHVLDGVLSPIEGVGPDQLNIRELLDRVQNDDRIKEVILATNPSMEGDATALYIKQQLLPFDVRITRLARGLPVGSDLEYTDANTLLRALAGRQELD